MKQFNNITISLKKGRILAVLLFTLILISPNNISAQSLSLSLAPTVTELVIKPGKSAVLKYKLRNIGDPAIIKIEVTPFETKEKIPIDFELNNQALRLGEPIFLKNSASEDLFLNVSIPEETPEKDYYFNLVVQSQPPPIQEGTANIRAKITVMSNLLITVTKEGETEIKPNMSLFEIIPKHKINLLGFKINLFDSYQDIPVILVVDNKGKNLIKPRGEIVVRGPFWQNKEYKITGENVLAGLHKQISLEIPGFFIGNYKLSANLSFGEGTPAIFGSTQFTVIPIRLMLILLTLSILSLLIFSKLRKN